MATIIVGFFAIGLHEYAHCKFADMAGDPTPRYYGRVTLNLTKHFDPLGTIMMLVTATTGRGIGWGKPAPINPAKMRNPRWDTFIAVAAGPLTNLLQAVVWGIFARILLAVHLVSFEDIFMGADGGRPPSFIGAVLYMGVLLNLSLCFFNLFPIPPLDGHWLLGLLMPEKPRDLFFLYGRRYGGFVLLALVLIGQQFHQLSIFRIVDPVIEKLAVTIFGIPAE
jgi:Zn-dependent protease